MKRKHNRLCYFCGDAATTTEHIPPKQLFKGFSCDSITVPSCDKHNTQKSGDDQAIASSMLIPIYNGLGQYAVEPEVITALENAKPSFERAKRKSLNVPLIANPPERLKIFPNVSHISPSANIKLWVCQITAGLLYSVTKAYVSEIEWNASIIWSPDWIESDLPEPIEYEKLLSILQKKEEINGPLEELDWLNGWSADPRKYPPAIYAFHIYFVSEQEAIFKHKFYNRYTWYVWLSMPKEIIEKVRIRLDKAFNVSTAQPPSEG